MAVTTYYFSLNASSAPSSTVYVFVSSNLSSTPTKASLVSGQAYLRTTASTYSSLASPVYVWLSSNSSSYVDAGYYHFDMQVGVNTDIFTIMLGILVLEQGVTEEVQP